MEVRGPLDPLPRETISRTYAEPLASATVELLRRGGPRAVSVAQMTALAGITAEALRQVGLRRDQIIAEVGHVLAQRWDVWSSGNLLSGRLRMPVSERDREQVRAYRAWAVVADTEAAQGRSGPAAHLARAASLQRDAVIDDRRYAAGDTRTAHGSNDQLAATVIMALAEGLRDAVSRRDDPCDPAAATAALRALTPAVWQWAEEWSAPDSLAS